MSDSLFGPCPKGSKLSLDDQRYRGKERGRKEGLEVHRERLAPDLRTLGGVADWFRSGVHVALTARGQPHSCLGARLEVSQRRGEQWYEKRQSPAVGCSAGDQRCCSRDTDSKRDQTKPQALLPLTRSDIGNARGRHDQGIRAGCLGGRAVAGGGADTCARARLSVTRPRTMRNTPSASNSTLKTVKSPRKTESPRINPIAMMTAPQMMFRMDVPEFKEVPI